MPTARAIFQAHVDDLLAESVPLSVTWAPIAFAIGEINLVNLISGNNTITVAGTVLIFQAPSTNTATILWKGVAGDTGTSLHPTDPTVYTFSGATPTFVLTAGANITGCRFIWL